MIRLLKIARSELKGVSGYEFLSLLKHALFKDEPIIIYTIETSQVSKMQEYDSDAIGVRKGDIPELEQTKGYFHPIPWEFQCHHYDRVRDFFISYNSDGIQHISWIYYKDNPNRILCLGAQDAEIKYSLTLPPFRGRGLYSKVLKAIVRFLGQQGFRRVFICVREDNKASIRGIEKAGFKLVRQIRLRKMMGVQVSKRFDTKEV